MRSSLLLTSALVFSVALSVAASVTSSATTGGAAFPLRHGVPVVNATYTYIGACATRSGGTLIAQGDGSTSVLVALVSAEGDVTDLSAQPLLGNEQASLCGTDTIIVTSTGGMVAVNVTGHAPVRAGIGMQKVAAFGAGLYVTALPSGSFSDGQFTGFALPAGSLLFNLSNTGTYPLKIRPTLNAATGLPVSVWVGSIFGNGTVYDGSNGIVVTHTPANALNNAVSYAALPSVLYATTQLSAGEPVQGIAFSWTTGAVAWMNNNLTLDAQITVDVSNNLVMGAALENPQGQGAVQMCVFVAVEGRSGRTFSTASWPCPDSYGTSVAAIGDSLASVGSFNDRHSSLVVVNVTTGAQIVTVNSQDQGVNAQLPVATACDEHTIVLARLFATSAGLVQPVRFASYDAATGAALSTSEQVLTGLPTQLACVPAATGESQATLTAVTKTSVAAPCWETISVHPARVS